MLSNLDHELIAHKLSPHTNSDGWTVKPEYNGIWLDFLMDCDPILNDGQKILIRNRAFELRDK